jgi:CO dehydrogenase/acetyl-CoA synthase beta subunit
MRKKKAAMLRNVGKGACAYGIALALSILFISACATGNYTPLAGAEKDEVQQLKENVYRVEYRVSSFTSQEQLDTYLRRRCAELTLREGYDFFHLAQRADVLTLSRRTSITVTMYKGSKPPAVGDLYDAKEVLAQPPMVLKADEK